MSLWKTSRFIPSAVLILLVAVLTYLPVYHADFIWDDDDFLTDNPLIHAPDGLHRFWCTTQAPDYFPLVSSQLWFEWRFFGPHAAGFHIVNVLLHAISAILLWQVLLALKIPGAFWAGLIFAVHPVNVESVAWITERKNTLPMVFYLLTILLFLQFHKTRQTHWYLLALAAFVLALLGKTAVVMIPFVLLICLIWLNRKINRNDFLQVVPFFILSFLFGLITLWFQYNRAIGKAIVRDDNFLSRLALAAKAVWFYLEKALIPINLNFVYPRWSADTSSIWTYLPLALLLATFLLLWILRTRGCRPVLLALTYFVLSLLPVLGFLNIYFMKYSLVADHWQYFAIPGIITLIVGMIFASLGKVKPIFPHAVSVLVVLILSALSYKQSAIYQNQQTLWTATLAKNPDCWLGHDQLGIALAKQNNIDEAMSHFRESLRINPKDDWGYYNLGLAHAIKENHTQAVEAFSNAIKIAPHRPIFHYHLGLSLLALNQNQQAVAAFNQALKITPNDIAVRVSLGNAYVALKKIDLAAEQYQKVLDLRPDQPEAVNNLQYVSTVKDNAFKKIRLYTTTLEVNPKNPDAHYQIALACEEIGRYEQALNHYRQALEYKPRWPEAMAKQAFLLATSSDPKTRQTKQALDLARQACDLSLNPSAEMLDILAVAYAESGDFGQAVQIEQKALDKALSEGKNELVSEIKKRLELFKANQPYRM